MPPSQRLPCFVYIDECQDYLATNSNFTMILEQARKQNVGHHRGPPIRDPAFAKDARQPLCQHQHQVRGRRQRQGRLCACPQHALRAEPSSPSKPRAASPHSSATRPKVRSPLRFPLLPGLKRDVRRAVRGRSWLQIARSTPSTTRKLPSCSAGSGKRPAAGGATGYRQRTAFRAADLQTRTTVRMIRRSQPPASEASKWPM